MATRKKHKQKRGKSQVIRRREAGRYRRLALIRATETLLGSIVHKVEYPGGKNRESVRLILDDNESVIATRRDTIQRARIEVSTLKALNKHGAHVPRLLASNHSHILIQEEIHGLRLSASLKGATEDQYEKLIGATLESLSTIHEAATAEDLESMVDVLGNEHGWIAGLIERPSVIGEYLGVKAPELPTDKLLQLLQVKEPRFIKWDARPGNAMVNEEGEVFWFDWEHAGNRNRLDDVAWVLGDEFLPDYPNAEKALIERFLPLFADVLSVDEGREYFMAYGTFHLIVRIGLILRHMDGTWWDLDYCIDADKVGVTLECAQRLCTRGARWAKDCEPVKPLSRWFEDVSKRLETL